jgi:hypothetical protein
MYKKFDEGKEAYIILRDGTILSGRKVEIGVDSSSCIQKYSKASVCIPQSEVKEIRTKNHGKGAIEGLGFGILAGFLVTGIALNKIDTEKGDAHTIGSFAGLGSIGGWIRLAGIMDSSVGIVNAPRSGSSTILGSIGAGIVGTGIIGSIVGAAIGHTDKYVISSSRPNKFVKFNESPIKIRVSSIVEENDKFVTVKWQDKLIRLSRWEIKDIEKRNEIIYILIWKKVYQDKFE